MAPVGDSTGGSTAEHQGTQAGNVSPPVEADSAPAAEAMQQQSEWVAGPPAGSQLVTATSTQLQLVRPPSEEVGPPALMVLGDSQHVQRRVRLSPPLGGGRSEDFDFGAAAGLRKSPRTRKPSKRLWDAAEGPPSEGSEGSGDRDMPPHSGQLVPSGQG